jgi:hypothetical protein
MKIGIIGQPCIDEIIAPDGSLRASALGGILYSYAALEAAMRTRGSRDSFLALSWNSAPDQHLLSPLFERFQRLGDAGLWSTVSLSNRVKLVYATDADRSEHCASILPSITASELERIALDELDGVFVNMISGFDISLDTFEWLSARMTSTYIHLDVHALVLGELSAKIGIGRVTRGVESWDRWIRNADTVQLNELEARTLASPSITDEAALIQTIRRLASGSSNWRTKGIIITRAERGATYYDVTSNHEFSIPVPETNIIDTTGSGDVFGSAFLFQFLVTKDAVKAMRFAIEYASRNAEMATLEEWLR